MQKLQLLQRNKATLINQIDKNNQKRQESHIEYLENGKREREALQENRDKLLSI